MYSEYTSYKLKNEMSSQDFSTLIDLSLLFSENVSLITRDEIPFLNTGNTLLKELDQFNISTKKVTEWHGTKLLEGTATQFIYKNSPDLINVFKKYITNYFQLLQPDFPEDLCFLKADGSPWFASVSHEKYCWLLLNKEEKDKLESLWSMPIEVID